LRLEKVFEYNNKLMGNDPSTAHIKAATIGVCKDWAGGCKCYQCMAYAIQRGIPRQRDEAE
jgi:hypothetical protein